MQHSSTKINDFADLRGERGEAHVEVAIKIIQNKTETKRKEELGRRVELSLFPYCRVGVEVVGIVTPL